MGVHDLYALEQSPPFFFQEGFVPILIG